MHAAFFVIIPIIPLLSVTASGQEAISDAESSTHGSGDAFHQLVETYSLPGAEIVQFNLPVLSHYSYLLISDQDALVVDPDRDVDAYLEYAKTHGLNIRGVFLTHSHADFVAGHLELAALLDVPIYQHVASGAKYEFEPLRDGSTFNVGSAVVQAIETPGHTPDGMCALVLPEGGAQPAAIFTGDTLFVGSIGRPDLLEGEMTAAKLAGMSYETWHGKLSQLPDSTLVLPAHGAGSLCGAHLSDHPSSTIAQEKASNPYLQHRGRNEFIAAVLEDLPEAPQYFRHNAALNRDGPPKVDWRATPGAAEVDEALASSDGLWPVDVRASNEYAVGHVPGSVNIGLRGRFETWVGTMIPWGAQMILLGSEPELKEAVFRLHRVGYRAEVLTMDSWRQAGLPLAQSGLITPPALHGGMQSGDAPLIVDVRLPNEWMGLRIGTVVNLPLNRLAALSRKLDPELPVVTVCNSAYRSSMAVGILQREGFKNVASLTGGTQAWIDAGYPVYGSERASVSATPKREVQLAERLSATELISLIQDLPGTFDLVDIRPPETFADYRIPASRNVHISDVLSDPAYLTGAGPLVVVDRDGSLAMMVAGVLSQKTQRPIKALHGGLEAYWRETELDWAVREVPLNTPKAPRAHPQPPTTPLQPSTPIASKKKSAGC